jgi:hypothetical protein
MRVGDLLLEQRPQAEGPEEVAHQGQRALKFFEPGQRFRLHAGYRNVYKH